MDWKKYKMELEKIAEIFEEISNEKNAKLTIDEKDWPSISLEWVTNGWEKKLQFFLKDDRVTYSLTGYKTKGESQLDYKADIYKLLVDLKYPFESINKELILRYYEQINEI